MKTKCVFLAITLALALPVTAATFGSMAQVAEQQELKVDLNQAGPEELEELPGIGQKVAQRILEYREANGPFDSSEELMNVRGIGEKTYMKLEAYVTVSKKPRNKK